MSSSLAKKSSFERKSHSATRKKFDDPNRNTTIKKYLGEYKFDDPNRNTTIKNIWEIQI